MAASTPFMATIDQTSMRALKPVRTSEATRLRTRKRITRACSRETTSSTDPAQPSASSQLIARYRPSVQPEGEGCLEVVA